MSHWGVEHSQSAKWQTDSQERPAALIKNMKQRKRQGLRQKGRQPITDWQHVADAVMEILIFKKDPIKRAQSYPHLDQNITDYYNLRY